MKINNIWKNRKQILEGLKNNIFKKEDIEEVYKGRLEVCKSCEFYDTQGTGCAVSGTQPCCSNCGCSLALKLRCLSCECPMAKWSKLLTEKEIEKYNEQLL